MTLILGLLACSDVENQGTGEPDEQELITRVEISLEPEGEGSAQLASWSDPELDGDPEVVGLTLPLDGAFRATVRFYNDLAQPSEEMTGEIEEAGEEHQIFFTGDINGPAVEGEDGLVLQEYQDQDLDGLPIGLDNRFSAVALGSGELVLTLRHLPPVSGEAVKVAGLAEQVAEGGFVSLPGDTDVQVSLPLEVIDD